jgi:hypothetical protein
VPGKRTQYRALHFTKPWSTYRVVTSADSSVDPDDPPADIEAIDLSQSDLGANNQLQLAVRTDATCTLYLWMELGDRWFFVEEAEVTVSGRNTLFVFYNLPGGTSVSDGISTDIKYYVTVPTMGGSLVEMQATVTE